MDLLELLKLLLMLVCIFFESVFVYLCFRCFKLLWKVRDRENDKEN